MSTLYELSEEYKFLSEGQLYDPETGEVNEEIITKLNELSDSIETKCINIVKVFKEIDMKRKAIEEEKKNMCAREKVLKNEMDRLKDYLLYNMENCGIKKIECPQFMITLQKNPPSLETIDEKIIPDEYKKISIELDNAKIKDDLINGVVIPGARLVQKNSVRFK